MSLYGDYIKERENKEIIENEYGFATYQFLPEGRCYITDIYIHPDHRCIGAAALLADRIADIAKDKGCKVLLGSVCPQANHSTESLKILLAYGFKLDCAEKNFILFAKEI